MNRTRMFRQSAAYLGLLVLWVVCTLNSQAQSTTGSIYGTVADSTGAAIPNSTVTAKDVRTGVEQTVTANGAGEFVIPNVKPATTSFPAALRGSRPKTSQALRFPPTRTSMSSSLCLREPHRKLLKWKR